MSLHSSLSRLWALSLLACNPSTPPPEAAPKLPLWNARALRLPEGRFCFDSQKAPILALPVGSGWRLEFGGEPLEFEIEQREEGRLLKAHGADLSSGEAALCLLNRAGWRFCWPARWGPPPDQLPVLQGAVKLRKEGKLKAAVRALELILAGLKGWERLWALVELGRIHYRSSQAPEAIRAWSTAAELAESLGYPGEAANRMRAIVHLHYWRRDFQAAERWLKRAERLVSAPLQPVAELRCKYLWGLLAAQLGAFREAEAALRRVVERGEALALPEAGYAGMMLGWLLQTLGRHGEAMSLYKQLAPRYELNKVSKRDRATFLSNRGWIRLLGSDRGLLPLAPVQTRGDFEAARQLFQGLGDLGRAANASINLAWLAQRRGASAEAQRLLEEVKQVPELGIGRFFAQLLEADLLAAQGAHKQTQALCAALEREAEGEWPGSEIPWRAAFCQGRALEAQGQGQAALKAFQGGLKHLERMARFTGVREDRAPFFRDRQKLSNSTLRLLLRQGELSLAFQVADRAQAQVLQALEGRLRVERLSAEQREVWEQLISQHQRLESQLKEQRARGKMLWREEEKRAWQQEKQQLRSQRDQAFDVAWEWLERASPGAALSNSEPLQLKLGARKALILFLQLGELTEALWLREGELRHLKQPFQQLTQLSADLKQLYVIPGSVKGVYQALQPLMGQLSLSFLPSLGLLRVGERSPEGAPLVLADPERNLPGARREGERVAELLKARLWLGAQIRAEPLWSTLSGSSLLHFAGHGDLRAADPWAAHLRLAGGERLDMESLLLRRPRLGLVVLSGCATGRRLSLAGHQTLGLPEAFLLAGAFGVLAARRDLEDGEAERFMWRFYQAGGATQPAEALREATARSQRLQDPVWSAFQLWGG